MTGEQFEWLAERVTFEANGCWSWRGAHARNGYALFRRPDQPSAVTHRVVYELLVGPIPDGLTLDHLCRNRGCINPDHLEAVTQRVNTLRGTSPSANNARKTHCDHGHEFTPENTYFYRDRPGRMCKTCRRESHRRHRQKVGAA